jgi:hypothetical protein
MLRSYLIFSLESACWKPSGMKHKKSFELGKYLQQLEAVRNKELFFIMSMPKSGSTWLMNLLNGHEDICCWGEGHLPNHLLPSLGQALKHYETKISQWHHQFKGMGLDQKPPALTEEDYDFLYFSAMAMLFSKVKGFEKSRVVGEKTPDNLYAAFQLSTLFPKARFLHIIRDGRDAAVSGWNMRKEMNTFRAQFRSFESYAGFYAEKWAQGVEKGREFGRQTPDRYLEIKYEDLHHNYDETVSDILDFLGVEASPKSLLQCQEAGSFKKSTKGRSRGKENKASFFRKGVVGDWKHEMDDAALNAFMQHSGKMLETLGYTV